MIKAEHKKWARLLYDYYIVRLLKKNFNNFYIVNEFPYIPLNSGLIITPNHFSWWDGFFIDFVCRKFLKRKIHLLMIEEQLERYWFFKKVGAFSIKLNDFSGVAASLIYSRNIVSNPENFLVIYPQGEIEAYDKRPPEIKDGLISIVRNISIETFVLPIAFKIQYGDKKNPDIIARAGNLINKELLLNNYSLFKDAFERNLIELDKAVLPTEANGLF